MPDRAPASRAATHRAQDSVAVLVAFFALFLAILAGLAIVGIDLQSSVRAYVGGEGLWSKAQKDAVFDLDRYLSAGDEDAFQGFERRLSVPMGDRRAREELQKTSPRLQAATEGFLTGRNNPEDIDGMIRLFRRFRWMPEMERAIAIWTQGDAAIAEVRDLARRIRTEASAGPIAEPRRKEYAAGIRQLNARLTLLEDDFSATLGIAARRVNKLLVLAIVGFGLVLGGTGAYIARRIARRLVQSESDLRDSERRHRELLEITQYRASHDPLTDLPNRSLFNDRLEMAFHQARRRDQLIAVMYIDLDDFKAVNDTHGHAAGDELLIQAGRRLTSCLRAEDTVARLGGDEFILMLSGGFARPTDVAVMAGKVLGAFLLPFDVRDQALRVSASMGIALFPRDGESGDKLLANADAALYRAKESGKNTFRFFS